MPVGVESAHGFGDICFNAPLMKAIQQRYDDQLWVAIRPHCKDGLFNLSWVHKIVEIKNMGDGISKLRSLGCDPVIQITQNVKFFEFREIDPNHSLIDTPLLTGRQLGLPDFDQRPIFIPTNEELEKTDSMLCGKPTIAIESVYNSGQSWAGPKAINQILEKYVDTHRVLWLSNEGAPDHPNVDNLLRFTRREVIMCLRACEIFFSVGSGFFCATLSLPSGFQPVKTVCLWKDEFYRYEHPVNKHKWCKDLTWLHNRQELDVWLNS